MSIFKNSKKINIYVQIKKNNNLNVLKKYKTVDYNILLLNLKILCPFE